MVFNNQEKEKVELKFNEIINVNRVYDAVGGVLEGDDHLGTTEIVQETITPQADDLLSGQVSIPTTRIVTAVLDRKDTELRTIPRAVKWVESKLIGAKTYVTPQLIANTIAFLTNEKEDMVRLSFINKATKSSVVAATPDAIKTAITTAVSNAKVACKYGGMVEVVISETMRLKLANALINGQASSYWELLIKNAGAMITVDLGLADNTVLIVLTDLVKKTPATDPVELPSETVNNQTSYTVQYNVPDIFVAKPGALVYLTLTNTMSASATTEAKAELTETKPKKGFI